METKKIPVSDIEPNKGQIQGLPANPRKWTREQLDRLKASIQETPELLEARGILVVKNGDKYVALGGNMRLAALKAIKAQDAPCIIIPEGMPAKKLKEIVAKDNGTFGDWDADALMEAWGDLPLFDWGIAFDAVGNPEGTSGSKKAPEAKEDNYKQPLDIPSKVKSGEVWQLGEHRLMCGDATSADDVAKLMNGEKADLVFTDPPYGMKKEKDGVLNDNLNFSDLLEFNRKWIPISFKFLKDNGSWYCWGMDEPLMDIYSEILKPMQRENKITFRNLITWKKENDNPTMLFNGACSANNRSFYTNEKCLFVMAGVQGFNNNSDNYFEGWEPIRAYLENEAKKVGLTNTKLKQICGVGMFAHWFTKSQYCLIPEEHYKKIQGHYKGKAFAKEYDELKKEYDELKKEYDELKKEYYSSRAYFNGSETKCIDVWVEDVTSKNERTLTGGHATPKPIALCSRGIKSSSREGEVVLDLFGGSGSTLIACEQLDRKCRMMELAPRYCDVIIDRWEVFTGKKAVRL